MAIDLQALRNKVNNAQHKLTNFDSSAIFSFSKLDIGDQVRIRFIADGDSSNDFFWRTRSTRTLRFNSLKLANGEIVDNRVYVSVPAFNIKKNEANIANLPEDYLYYSNDDILNQKIKPFWDGTKEGQDLYNKFGRTERYVFQGFIRSEGYEKKLYRFVINKELFNVIYSFMTDDEIEHMPSDCEHGRDFILKVTKKSANINGTPQDVKDYSTSKWSSLESTLNKDEVEWLAENEPFELKNYIPSRPSTEQENVMLEMFNASYNDQPYDVAKWGKIFRPDNIFFDDAGNIKDMKGGKSTASVSSEIPAPTPVVENVVPQQFTAEQLQAMLSSMQASSNNTPEVKETVSATQLIKENSVEVSGETPQMVINDILAKFNVQK